MGEAALANDGRVSARVIKISSKRQITIPADMYEKAGFLEYAYATFNEDGSITVMPINVRDEKDSVKILRSLLSQGLDGKELVDEYERIVHPVIDYRAAIEKGLEDIEHGRIGSFDEMQERLKTTYGL